jgi:hypothetical protein
MPTEIKLSVSQQIINEIIASTKQIMIQYKLGNTALINSIEWQYKENIFMMIANDYFQWVNSGRRPRARKVPVEALIKWLKKKNIVPSKGQTINSLAFAIQNSIYKVGIRARMFTDPIIGITLDTLEMYIADQLSVQIADEIAAEMTFELGHA